MKTKYSILSITAGIALGTCILAPLLAPEITHFRNRREMARFPPIDITGKITEIRKSKTQPSAILLTLIGDSMEASNDVHRVLVDYSAGSDPRREYLETGLLKTGNQVRLCVYPVRDTPGKPRTYIAGPADRAEIIK